MECKVFQVFLERLMWEEGYEKEVDNLLKFWQLSDPLQTKETLIQLTSRSDLAVWIFDKFI